MRLLHTSDWHLGLTAGPASRGPDHDHVLDWLLDCIEAEQIDALLVAGDIFDTMQPSSAALQRYYRFLARASTTGLSQVVVIGGNHDSAARLEAPAPILDALQVHVVGGISASEASQQGCIVPLRTRGGDVGAVALAVPYVHEFRLGVRTTDLDASATRQAFLERFQQLYTRLVDRAREQFPGVPVVALGHLTVGSQAERADYPHEIHQVGTVDALPPRVFDPRIQYVALGHIHRSYPADDDHRVWYSGTPLATSLHEAQTPRRVLRVDLADDPRGTPAVQPLEVPVPRALVEIEAEPDALVDRVAALEWSEPLPPLLFCRARTDALPSELPTRVHEAIATHPEGARPVLVELRQLRESPLPSDSEAASPPLSELSPTEVFATLLQAAGRSDTDALGAAFAELASATDDDLGAKLGEIAGGLA